MVPTTPGNLLEFEKSPLGNLLDFNGPAGIFFWKFFCRMIDRISFGS